jgi:hypothetical protein
MATAVQYAEWIVRNKDKKGTKEFETVAAAYRIAKDEEAAVTQPAAAPAAPATEIPTRRRGPSLADIGDRATGFRAQVEATGMTPEQRQAAVAGAIPYAVGLAAGPAAGAVIRGAGVIAPAISRITAPLAEAVTTSGFRAGVPATAPAAQRVALRAAGGAIPGAITGATVSPKEAGTGAAVGAGISLLAPPVAKIVAKGGGAVVDALRGRTADIRANELIQTAANNEINALRQAMQAAPDQPASRVAADMDLPVLQALLAEAEKKDPRGVVNAFRAREATDTVNELSRIAGGPTSETARTARETAKGKLGELTGRIREEEIAKARRTGEAFPKLERIAAESRIEAKESADTVRRLSNAVNKADDWAQNWVTQSRMVEQPGGGFAREYGRGIGEPGVRLPARGEQLYTYPGQLAASGRQTTVGGPFERQVIDEGGVIAGRISKAAEESQRAGARARAAEATLQMKTARGEVPIRLGKLNAVINSVMDKPDIAANSQATAALNRINQMLSDRALETGIIDPADIYAIRKYGIASVIDELNPGADMAAKKKLTAQVLSAIKDDFDDAIENAGGKEFRNYLRSFERGMSDITGMELADNIRKLYAKGTPESKQQIIDLVRGESPEVVEDLFGSGRYKISEEMAKDMPFLRRVSDTLNLDLKAVQQAAAGRAALTEAQKKGSARIRFPFFTRASTAVNEVVAGLEQRMKAETLDVMIRAAQSGREFDRVLQQIPTKERNAFLAQFKNAESWSRFSREVANAARTSAITPPPDVTVTRIGNREIDQGQVRNALAQ